MKGAGRPARIKDVATVFKTIGETTPSAQHASRFFNADFIANWIDMKQKEYDALRLRPRPYEFSMYYDV